MADDLPENHREWTGIQPDCPDSIEEERETDSILQRWQVAPPASLEERILKKVRTVQTTRPPRWRGEIRVPWWLAAACVALLALMLPLAIRGLRAGSPAALSPGRPPTELLGRNASSMVARISGSKDSYLTVADLGRLRPTQDLNIRILKAEEAKR